MKASQAEIPPKARQKALFVSRSDVSTTGKDVVNHLRKVLPENVPINVTRLRSKNEKYYASFHVTVPSEVFQDIYDANVWPVKVQYRPYRGELQEYRKYGSINPAQEQGEANSPRRKSARLAASSASQWNRDSVGSTSCAGTLRACKDFWKTT